MTKNYKISIDKFDNYEITKEFQSEFEANNWIQRYGSATYGYRATSSVLIIEYGKIVFNRDIKQKAV